MHWLRKPQVSLWHEQRCGGGRTPWEWPGSATEHHQGRQSWGLSRRSQGGRGMQRGDAVPCGSPLEGLCLTQGLGNTPKHPGEDALWVVDLPQPTHFGRSTLPRRLFPVTLQKEVMETSPNTAGGVAGAPESAALKTGPCMSIPRGASPAGLLRLQISAFPTVCWETWLSPNPDHAFPCSENLGKSLQPSAGGSGSAAEPDL